MSYINVYNCMQIQMWLHIASYIYCDRMDLGNSIAIAICSYVGC